MIEIVAKENATIQLIKDKFPLGQRDIIKISIDDNVIKSRIKLEGTGQCCPKNNLFTYGYFDFESDINNDNIQPLNVKTKIISGVAGNYSNCLYVNFLTAESRIKFKADREKLQPDTKYKCGFYCKEDIALLDINCNCSGVDFTATKCSKDDESKENWYLYTSNEFTIEEETDFELIIAGHAVETYIDNISVFKTTDEIIKAPEVIETEIEIINPKQDIIINQLIRWNKTADDNIYVALYVPPITVVDYQDCIACCLKIYQPLVGKYEMFGDITYTEDREMIYKSELFKLQGYILPPDVDYDVDVDLLVEEI